MNKQFKFLSILSAAIITTFGASIAAQSIFAAWTGPTSNPPEGNVAKPIYNTGEVGQSLDGSLILNKLGNENGLILQNGDLALDNGIIHVKSLAPSDNAEIKIQSTSETDSHWGIYHDRTSDELRFWKNSINKMRILADGSLILSTSTSSSSPDTAVATKDYVDNRTSQEAKLLATSKDWTEEARYTITKDGIKIELDKEYNGEYYSNPILFSWPQNYTEEIIFEVWNKDDDYCIGGESALALNGGSSPYPKCVSTSYDKNGNLIRSDTTNNDWIRLTINDTIQKYCNSQDLVDTNEHYASADWPGRYGIAGWTYRCSYRLPAGTKINSLKVEEADWSPDKSIWEWKIYYKEKSDPNIGVITGQDEKITSCTELPTNTVPNTVSAITQTWNGSDWIPIPVYTHNETPSTSECRYKCAPGYVWGQEAYECNCTDYCSDVGGGCLVCSTCYEEKCVPQ